MQEDTYKKIRESLSFEKSGEEVYVEIGMKNVPPKIKTKTVVDFLKTLFEGAIDQLEAPVISSKESARGVPAEGAKGAPTLSEKGFERLMDNWLKKNKRVTFAASNTLQPGMVCDADGTPGPEMRRDYEKKKMRDTSSGVWIPGPPKREDR